MIRKSILTLLFLVVAATAFAAEDGIEVASLDKEGALRHYRPPLIVEKSEYYEIKGNSEKDLRKQMCKHGCTWDDGRTYDAVTSWYWTWDYGTDPAPEACSTEAFLVNLEITYRFPKWVRTDEAPQPLVDKWDNYMKNLTMHEYGHRDRVIDAASEFSNAVARLPRARNCAERDHQVQALSSELMAQLNEAQKHYDSVTNHGATQGARFP